MREWKKLGESDVFEGKIFKYRSIESESPDGSMKGNFDVLDFLDWVNIVAITNNDEMLFVEQFRQGSQSMTLEIPGGAIDRGEDPKEAAKRELLEETGFAGDNVIELGCVHPNPAIMGNRCWTYLITECDWIQDKNLDALEDIEIKKVPMEEVNDLVMNGEITHSLVIAALYYWESYKARMGGS